MGLAATCASACWRWPSQLGRASICREHRNGSTPVRQLRLRSSTGSPAPDALAHDSAKLADVLTDRVP